MDRPFRHVEVEIQGDVAHIRLLRTRLDETDLQEMGVEISRLIDEDGKSRLVLSLGPEEPSCLYSIFLAKLVTLQRRVKNNGGELVIAQASDDTRGIFRAAGLDRIFRFFPTAEEAAADLSSSV